MLVTYPFLDVEERKELILHQDLLSSARNRVYRPSGLMINLDIILSLA